MLVTLINEAPRTEPILRVYGNYMSFNMHASKLLGLEEGDKVLMMRVMKGQQYIVLSKI